MWIAALFIIGAGVPVALGATGWVGWLVWRTMHDSLPPLPRELPPPRRHVRAEIRVIRGAVEDGTRRPPG